MVLQLYDTRYNKLKVRIFMNFGKNLQNIRKLRGMSQEELADKLDVSRQAISKWESGGAYPEMEKLLELAKILNCTTDSLLVDRIKPAQNDLKMTYDKLMNRFSRWVSFAVGLVLFGVVLLFALQDLGAPFNEYGLVVFLIFVTLSVPIFVFRGIELGSFKEKHPKMGQIYTNDEIDAYNQKFMTLIAVAITIILVGLVVFIGMITSKVFPAESSLPVAAFMLFVTVGAPVLVFAGIRKSKYDIGHYNHENSEKSKQESEIVGRISGVIMLIATAVFMIMGFVWQIWEIAWVVFPVGGILCGIVAVILQKNDK